MQPSETTAIDRGGHDEPILARGAEPPLDLTHCWSCRRTVASRAIVVLVILTSPRGPYALCVECAGRDIQRPAGETPIARAVRRRRESAASETLATFEGEAVQG